MEWRVHSKRLTAPLAPDLRPDPAVRRKLSGPALRTFFNHFSSKEEAFVAAAAVGAEAFVAEFRARPPGESVLRAIREAVLVVMDRDDAVSRDHIRALRLMRSAPSLMPQPLS